MFDQKAGMRPQDKTHRVYVSFQDRHGWQCQFLEADLKTPLTIPVANSPWRFVRDDDHGFQ